MRILAGIAGLAGRLVGSPQAVEKAFDTFSGGIDKLVYTNEEKADAAREDTKEFRLVMVEWFKNSQGQNLSRRLLAMGIAFSWLGMFLLSCFVHASAIFVEPEFALKLGDAGSLIGDNAERLNGAVMLIIGFYFAAPHLGAIIKPAMEKFSKRS